MHPKLSGVQARSVQPLICSSRFCGIRSLFRPTPRRPERLLTKVVANAAAKDAQEAEVSIDNESDASYTTVVVEAENSPGLLQSLTTIFQELDLSVMRADVDTENGSVTDTFMVADRSGNKIMDDSLLQQLEVALVSVTSRTRQPARPEFGSSARPTAFMGMASSACAFALRGTVLPMPSAHAIVANFVLTLFSTHWQSLHQLATSPLHPQCVVYRALSLCVGAGILSFAAHVHCNMMAPSTSLQRIKVAYACRHIHQK